MYTNYYNLLIACPAYYLCCALCHFESVNPVMCHDCSLCVQHQPVLSQLYLLKCQVTNTECNIRTYQIPRNGVSLEKLAINSISLETLPFLSNTKFGIWHLIWINSAGIWSIVCDLCFLNFSVAVLNLSTLSTGTISSSQHF